jgi:hypothetical protein
LAAHWLVKRGSATYAYDVNITQSKDGGKSWSKPIVPHRDNTQTEHGFVSLIPLNDGRLGANWLDGRNMKNMKESVCWLSGNVEGGQLKVRRIEADGSVGPPAVIARTDISRSSGFPRMARLGDQVHFAWTEFGKPARVRTAVTDVSAYK